jgi:hypothetical protein
MDPSGPRALQVLVDRPLRYLIEVSIVVCDSVEGAINWLRTRATRGRL